MSKKHLKFLYLLPCAALVLFIGATLICLKPITASFDRITAESHNVPVTDRSGIPLAITYKTDWNSADRKPLYEMPDLLTSAFLFSEDRKFYGHGGVDWKARGAALWQNIRHRKTVRGASTITEQVVRMINPRPRNLWSKWLEGIEAALLEREHSKTEILEFYMNQVPYASGRRGVAQAARYYYNRDLKTLGAKEMLSLVILARAPSAYDLYANPGKIDAPLNRLATQMKEAGKIAPAIYADIGHETLETVKPSLPVDARHFARFIKLNSTKTSLRTTLDSSLQSQVQNLLDTRMKKLAAKHVTNAGVLVIDHTNGDILAWVVAGARNPQTKSGDIDTVTTPRQPGSTLKPFVYASALEKGWTAATILDDAPIAEKVGSGLHRFRNYSNTHYGPITVREALGNSLNIPAILAVNYVGVDPFLNTLHELGFDSLNRGADIYDEGIALGNGEVTLYELVRAYSTLANKGQTRPLRFTVNNAARVKSNKIFTPETASIIGNILSDPRARALEFGNDSILNLPIRTAAKTGTSTDYRDAWTIGYNDRYTVGIWMGNLDRTPMKDVTGSTGPALVMRGIFQILNKDRDTKPLYLSPALIEQDVCTRPRHHNDDCPRRTELFVAGTQADNLSSEVKEQKIELVRPTQDLMIAYDPRIPSDHQKFRFELAGLKDGDEAEWILNGQSLGRGPTPRYLWPVQKGRQELAVIIHSSGEAERKIAPVRFTVR